ncbi:hypothetical protein KXV85_002778, partial [Aspergillus fumigatus]
HALPDQGRHQPKRRECALLPGSCMRHRRSAQARGDGTRDQDDARATADPAAEGERLAAALSIVGHRQRSLRRSDRGRVLATIRFGSCRSRLHGGADARGRIARAHLSALGARGGADLRRQLLLRRRHRTVPAIPYASVGGQSRTHPPLRRRAFEAPVAPIDVLREPPPVPGGGPS